MRVWDTVSKTYLTRSVVIVADNSGKVYCVDASGNGDGNDILLDADNNQVYIDNNGIAYDGGLPGSGGYTGLAPLPLHPTNYGTTSPYWIWQPNTGEPFSAPYIIDEHAPAPSSVTATPPADWTSNTGVTGAYDTNNYSDPVVARASGNPTDYFTYSPLITAGEAGATKIFVWDAGPITGEAHITDARYTVVDDTGAVHTCEPIDQTTAPGGTPGFVQLQDATSGQTTFDLGTTANTSITGFAKTPDTVILDNTTTNTIAIPSQVVDADAIELVFSHGGDADSNLIGPLAFGTCSPTVHVVPTNTTTYPTVATHTVTNTYTGTSITYDAYDSKIYIGNSNGVLYALDGAGNDDGADIFQRDFSQDPVTPSPSVDWWFNVGVTSVDVNDEIEDSAQYISEAISGTPTYYHPAGATTTAYDQILFSTYSPQNLTNNGTLYSVNAIGPVGDYGTGQLPDASADVDYRTAAGLADYNLSPIPYFSFPDAYGTLHLPNDVSGFTLPTTDHVVTTLQPAINGIKPAANSLGDSAGSPVVFGNVTVPNPNGGALETLPEEVYFAANDPTIDGEQPSQGRIWGVELSGSQVGTVDAAADGLNTYVYPNVSALAGDAAAPATFDPNAIGLANDVEITNVFDNADPNLDTTPFGPFTGQADETGVSDLNYYLSSSPAAGIVHTIPNPSSSTSNGTLTDTLTGSNGFPTEYGSSTGAYDIDVPMLYVGDLAGTLHSINLAGFDDDSRFIQDAPLDQSAIISTPVLLTNGNGPNIASETGSNAGGVLFITSSSGALWESEAFPFIEDGLTNSSGPNGSATTSPAIARNVDFEYAGPGGISSVSTASYNIDNFEFETAVATGNVDTNTISTAATSSVDTSEWLYASGDDGFTYGLTPNNSSLGNGGFAGGFNPGSGVQPGNQLPPNVIPLNRNFYVSVFSTNPLTSTSSTTFDPVNGRPPQNPIFDWGQTVYIAVYGLDDPNAGNGTAPNATATYPKAISLTFSIGPASTFQSRLTVTKRIDLQSTGTAVQITPNGSWPPPGFVLTSPTSSDPYAPAVGDYAAVYAFQLGNGTGGDPQTPGAKIQITNVKESVYYFTAPPASQFVSATIGARSNGGTTIREPKAGGGYQDVAMPPVDNETFSILNPLGIRTAGRSMGAVSGVYQWYNLTLSAIATGFEELGPFCGIPALGTTETAAQQFALAQPAMGNGGQVAMTQVIGGTQTTASGGTINPNDPLGPQLGNQRKITIISAVAPGLVTDGASGNSATVDSAGTDPETSDSPTDTVVTTPVAPGATSGGSYGQSMLDIADRSAVGTLDVSLNAIKVIDAKLGWQDNSGAGGAMSVVNPLPWERMPSTTNSTYSLDYPNINTGNVSIELLPRNSAVSNNYNTGTSPGTDSILTNSAPGTLASSSANQTAGDYSSRIIYPNAAMVRVNVPVHQPANLDSYPASATTNVKQNGETRFDANAGNVGMGYSGAFETYVNTATTPMGAPDLTKDAYRIVTVWISVPVDFKSSIAEQTIDVGSVPAGYGLDLDQSSGVSNDLWSPFNLASSQQSADLSQFFKPFTLLNNGNTNFINLHLNQYNNYTPLTGTSLLEPNPFGSYDVSALSTIPSFDTSPTSGPLAGLGPLTSTPDEPIVRSSLDYFNYATPTNPFNAYYYGENPYVSSTTTPPPGPVGPKPRVGDGTGALVTVPPIPHTNLPDQAGFENLSTLGYVGRPALSIAVPLGTPAGQYSQSVNAFEGSDGDSNVFEGPLYGNEIYTNSGWMTANGTTQGGSATAPTSPYPTSVLNVVQQSNGTTAAEQTQSNPGTVLKVNVIEGAITDTKPLQSTTLAYVDSGLVTANSSNVQPWAFYDPAGNTVPTFGLLWTSSRDATTTTPATPYSLFSSGLSANNLLLNTPTSSNGWWTAPTRLTETSTPAYTTQSFGASTFATPNTAGSAIGAPLYALWVNETQMPLTATSTVSGAPSSAATRVGAQLYTLYMAPVTYTNNQPTIGAASTWSTLFTTTQPIYTPRASYIYTTAANVYTGFALPTTDTGIPTNIPSAIASAGWPLIVYSTRVGGRSTLMYWPASATSGTTTTIAPAPVPLASGLTAATTPTIVPRPTVGLAATPPITPEPAATVPQIDLVFSGNFGGSTGSDIVSARYSVAVNATTGPADGTAVLTPAPTLPIAAYTTVPAAPLPAKPTELELLTATAGTSTWQARDTSWYRDTAAFELLMQTSTPSGATAPYQIPLVPAGSNGIYDRASGQWVFAINWTNLEAAYSSQAATIAAIADWWAGVTSPATPPNVVVYTNPNSGLVTFSIPLPTSETITTSTGLQFQSLYVDVNPQMLRTTYQSQTNTEPVAFIDDTPKLDAAPGFNFVNAGNNAGQQETPVETARYWYVYRKQSAASGNSAAASSVLYYNTRRLTLVLQQAGVTTPVQLTDSGASTTPEYSLTTPFSVTDANGVDVTHLVDVDWARGRIYFPETYTSGSNVYNSEGQLFTVTYIYTIPGSPASSSSSTTYTGVATWQDEPEVNSATDTTAIGEHPVPINAPANEGEPSAFLDPEAGQQVTGGVLALNPSTATPAYLYGQPYAHKVWVFWSSTRNASNTGTGSGSDVYWETIDPRFEIINP